MMTQHKPSASLSSGLLARKGQARPAMRPQGFLNLGGQPLDDLGWNDMGEDMQAAVPVPARVSTPAPAPPALEPAPVAVAAPEPTITDRIAAEPKPLPVAAVARLRREASRAKKAKAAFTLRLDADRHLRLRLAAALSHRSAQQLVTQALDNLLETMSDVEVLARQVDPTRDRG